MMQPTTKNDVPTCACGKPDLYNEWLKQQQSSKEEISDAGETIQAKQDYHSDDGNENKDKHRI